MAQRFYTGFNRVNAQLFRHRRLITFPIQHHGVIARFLQADRRSAWFFTRVLDAHGFIFFTGSRHEIVALGGGKQCRHHPHGA
ncbi:hypothetical protein D3C81_1551700 [compost metagenome]